MYRAHRASLPSSCLPAVGFYPWNFNCSRRVHVFVSYCATPRAQNVLAHLCLADVSKIQLSSHFLKEGSFLFIPAWAKDPIQCPDIHEDYVSTPPSYHELWETVSQIGLCLLSGRGQACIALDGPCTTGEYLVFSVYTVASLWLMTRRGIWVEQNETEQLIFGILTVVISVGDVTWWWCSGCLLHMGAWVWF